MKIRITKAGMRSYWYADQIGKVFEVTRSLPRAGKYYVRNAGEDQKYAVDYKDCEVIKPEVDGNMNNVKSLREIVKQLVKCGYTCEAGPLENNEDFRQLAQIAGVDTATLEFLYGKPARQFLAEQRQESAQEARDRIVAQAKADVARLIVQVKRKQGTIFDAEFTVNRDKRTVAARFQKRGSKYVPVRGIAKCAPDDCFNAHIGKAIALRRALGLEIPTEYLTVPQPTEVRVGDVIADHEGGRASIVEKYLTDRDKLSLEHCRDLIERGLTRGALKIIDDSRTEVGE